MNLLTHGILSLPVRLVSAGTSFLARDRGTSCCPVSLCFVSLCSAWLMLSVVNVTLAQEVAAEKAVVTYTTDRNIDYRANESNVSDYAKERCKLDLYHPSTPNYATVVWFHGGGLKNGNRFIPEELKEQGIAVVAVNYRLYPQAKAPAYVEDAAASVAWTFRNIDKYGGDPKKIFVSGHSAGGYLTSMVGFDKRWLKQYGVDADQIAGLIPYSGQTVTHSTVREERGIGTMRPIIDDMAPLYHIREDAPPTLLITGDREMEMRGRYEENAFLWRMLKLDGHPDVDLFELDGYNHGQMAEPAHPLLLRFVRRILKDIK